LLPVSISLPLKEPSLGVLLYKVGLFRGGAIVDNFIGRCGGGRRRRWKDGEVLDATRNKGSPDEQERGTFSFCLEP
jgi:hypothetical protein